MNRMALVSGQTILAGAIATMLLFSAMLSFFMPFSVSAATPKEKIKVGYVLDPGFHYVDEKGTHSGYDVEYLHEIAQYANLEYEFVEGTWTECLTWLNTGEIDLLGLVADVDGRTEWLNYTVLPAGELPIALYASTDNEKLEFDDYQAFDGKTVGVVKGAKTIQGFWDMQEKNEINCKIVEYPTNKLIRDAIKNGELDMGLYTSASVPAGVKAVVRFKSEPFYYGVAKGKPELLNKINEAMNQILSTDMDFNDELRAKYFGSSVANSLVLTKKEKEYIDQKKVLKVVYDPDFYPLERYNKQTQSFDGIAEDVLREICRRAGLKYEVTHTKNYTESLQLLIDGKADILTCINRSYIMDQDSPCFITRSYLEAQMVRMENRFRSGEITKIALPKNYYVERSVRELYPDAQIIYCDTVEACMEEVARNRADVTFANFYVATYLLSAVKFNNLNGVAFNNTTEEFAMGISKQTDPMLLSIINKGVESISKEHIDDMISAHTFERMKPSIFDVVYTNPMGVGILCLIIGVVIFLFLVLMLFNKQKVKNKLERLYYYDDLTEHGNYNNFLETAKARMAADEKQWYAVVYADMVDFKFINDTYGYEEGNMILKEVGKLFGQFIEEGEDFARLYADHFVLLLKFHGLPSFDARMDDLSKRLEMLSESDERAYRFLFYGGIYVFRQGELPINMAVDYANYAKKTVPKIHENTYMYYTNEIKQQIRKEKELELMMKGALGKEQFIPYFQPKVNVVTGELIGAEALVRWNHPEKGLISPGEFIPYFEKNGFVVKLDMYMYEEVCKRIRKWMDNGKKVFPISCNMSYLHVINPAFPKMMKDLVDRYEVSASLIELELTETVAVNNVETVTQCSNQLIHYGFTVSIDDFGSGYSSICLLQKIPVSVLKLDKEFVQTGACGAFQRDLVECLVAAVQKNHILVICEGVETREQEDFIIEIGCQFAQGYRYYKPMPDTEMEKLLLNLE